MGIVYEMRPFVLALDQLARSNRMDLRRSAIGFVRDEQKAGRSGKHVAREIQRLRLAHGRTPGGAA